MKQSTNTFKKHVKVGLSLEEKCTRKLPLSHYKSRAVDYNSGPHACTSIVHNEWTISPVHKENFKCSNVFIASIECQFIFNYKYSKKSWLYYTSKGQYHRYLRELISDIYLPTTQNYCQWKYQNSWQHLSKQTRKEKLEIFEKNVLCSLPLSDVN